MTDVADPLPAPGDTTASAVQVRGLFAGYGQTTVLRDVSINVPRGHVVALLGPNGAGKSTLLRTISGFVPASAGSVELFGRDMTRSAPYHRFAAGVCHIPEGRGVFRSLTVRENLMMQASKGDEAEAASRACEAFPILGSRINQLAGTLSGGEQQMLAMAAAYARKASLILVDEASLGLAPLIVDSIFEFLEQVSEQGSALLIVDQFAARALSMADHVYVLIRGEIGFSGTPRELGHEELISKYLGP
jgi:branched-chain amino acid transport system ATP-binding protein